MPHVRLPLFLNSTIHYPSTTLLICPLKYLLTLPLLYDLIKLIRSFNIVLQYSYLFKHIFINFSHINLFSYVSYKYKQPIHKLTQSPNTTPQTDNNNRNNVTPTTPSNTLPTTLPIPTINPPKNPTNPSNNNN
eukprot:207228_1